VRARDHAAAFGFWRPRFTALFLSVVLMLLLMSWLVIGQTGP
jgi:hypothetical protein